MRKATAVLVALVLMLTGCNLAGDITPPPSLATAQAAETLPAATVAPATSAPTATYFPLESTSVSSTAAPQATWVSPEVGAIRGTVTNGTAGGTLLGGLEVILSGFDGEEEAYRRSTVAAGDGTYSFSDVPAVPGRIYGVTVAYREVLYFSDGAHLTGGAEPLDLPVTVFDTMTDPAALSLARLHMVFDFTAGGQVQVIELWVMSNAGDRTVVGEDSGGTVRVSLPEGASDLGFEDGSVGDRYVLTEDGFQDTQPIVPGSATSQFIFSYVLPYDGSLRFQRSSGYPIDAVVVLLPQSGVRAQGDGLRDLGVQQMGGQAVHAYSGEAVAAGQAWQIELQGDPQAASASGSAGGANTAIGLGVLGILFIAAGLWWFRPAVSGRSSRPVGAPETEHLIGEIAELDDAFAAGGMDESAYRARRESLKRVLRERMR